MIGWLVSQAGLIGCPGVRCSHRGLSAVWGGAGHVAESPDRRREASPSTRAELRSSRTTWDGTVLLSPFQKLWKVPEIPPLLEKKKKVVLQKESL